MTSTAVRWQFEPPTLQPQAARVINAQICNVEKFSHKYFQNPASNLKVDQYVEKRVFTSNFLTKQ